MKRMSWIMAVVLASFLTISGNASATNLDSALGVAFSNVPPGADVAGMGNAWTATPNFSSNNPALGPTLELGEYGVGMSAVYTLVNLKDGPDIGLYSGSVAMRPVLGTLQVSYTFGNSNSERGGNDIEQFSFDRVGLLDLQYGFETFEGLYLGIGYTYSSSKASARFIMPTPEGMLDFRTVSKTHDNAASAGIMWSPGEFLCVGGFYRHTWSNIRDEVDFEGFVESENSSEFTDQMRLGVGFYAAKTTFLAVDFQHLNLNGTKKDQIFAGVEQRVVKNFLYLYGGWAANGPTVGLGIYFSQGGLNVTYMSRPFKEIDEFFGKSAVWMGTAYLTF